MLVSMTQAVRQFKQQWTSQLEPGAIEGACRQAGYRWRDRLLNPVTTVQLFFLQVLHGNTACTHLPHLAKMMFSATAYCQARMRLPLAVFTTLLRGVSRSLQADVLEDGRWRRHRTFFVDGSSFSMPDNPELQAYFGQPGAQRPGCGFPVAHLLGLFHAGTGMVLQVLAAPLRTHDMHQVVQLHPELRAGDLLVADRGFCSFVHLALLLQSQLHALFRIHQRQIVDFTPGRAHVVPGKGKNRSKKGQPRSGWLKQLGVTDQLVEWFKPAECPAWMTEEQFATLPETIVLRELRYRVGRKGFRVETVTLVTTLLDADTYPLTDLAQLYFKRWRIETNFGHLKTTMKMDVLKCKTVEGLLKELTVFALIYNLVRLVMLEASRRQHVDVERISFVDALRWLAAAHTDEPLTPLIVNPDRPFRYEPRVRKRRPKEYPLMKKPRHELRKALECNGDAN